MAKSVDKQSLKKPTKTLSGRKLPWIGLAMMGVLLGGGLIVWIAFSGVRDSSSEQKRMESYLEDKYEKKFTVGRSERKASGFGVEGYLEAEAYPDNDKSLKFAVRDASHSGVIDNYPGAAWSREETERLTPIIQQLFGSDVSPSIDIQTIGIIDIRGTIPSFKTGVGTYKKAIRSHLTIIGPGAVMSSVDKEKVSEQLLNLRDKLPLNQVTYALDYLIRLSDTHSYGVSLSGEDLIKIQSVGELTDQFKEYRRASA